MLWPSSVPAARFVPLGGEHFGRDHRAESAHVGPRLLDQLDAALAEQQLGVDDVHVGIQRVFKQPDGERGGDEPRVLARHFAAIMQHAPLRRGLVELRDEQAEPMGHVQISAEAVERLPIERAHVDRMADRAGREEIDQQTDAFDGYLRLGLFGARAQMRRASTPGRPNSGLSVHGSFAYTSRATPPIRLALIASTSAASS